MGILRCAKERKGLYLVAIIALSVALGFSLAVNIYQGIHQPVVAAQQTALGENWQTAFKDIAEKLGPSVVSITSEKEVQTRMPAWDDFFDFGPFRGGPQKPEPEIRQATGSGFVVRSDGYIMTNDHVVRGADLVTVRLPDGREFKGEVLRDPRTDLALIKIDADDLPALKFADSDSVDVGQWVAAIGSPFRLRNTLTVGVVSAVRKGVDPEDPLPYPEVIQTDAAINPGNSGGPLVDLTGRVVGVNGAIYSTTSGNIGIGFAIPSNTVKFVMNELIEKGKVVRGFLGVEMRDLTPALADSLGVNEGALVTNVMEDSAAEEAGIKVKDVIVNVNGTDIANGAELRRAVERIAPGKTVKVTVVRDGKRQTLNVTLKEAPSGIDSDQSKGSDKTGMTVQPLTEKITEALGLDPELKGVIVTEVAPGSAAARAGIQPKDIILEINNKAITSVSTFNSAVKDLKAGDTAIVVIQRGDRNMIVEMPIY